MRELIPIHTITDLPAAAENLRTLLQREDNSDISIDFPSTHQRYAQDTQYVVQELKRAGDQHSVGEHEQFVVYADGQPVGMSIVTNRVTPPDAIPGSMPNLSGFILHPYRQLGLGRFSLETRLDIVRRDFGRRAWTIVRDENRASNRLVQNVGFTPVDSDHGKTVYLFDESLTEESV